MTRRVRAQRQWAYDTNPWGREIEVLNRTYPALGEFAGPTDGRLAPVTRSAGLRAALLADTLDTRPRPQSIPGQNM